MSLRDILKTIVEKVEGGIGAVILGYDGIAIDEHVVEEEGVDVSLLAIEYTSLLKEVKRTVELLKTGEMEEVTVTTGTMRVLANAISEEFFIVLVVRSDGNFGKARYLLKRYVPEIRPELQ